MIVIDGGERWTYQARRALYLAGRVWGGAGFAVVPHRSGVVTPVLLRACRAYDPDFVVVVPTTERRERRAPGPFDASDWDELPASAIDREAGFQEGIDRRLRRKADERARVMVAEACSPYRRAYGGKIRREKVTVLTPGTEDLCLAVNLPGARGGATLACPPDWGGLLGVALASRLGTAVGPTPDAGEPEVAPNARYAISKRWFGDSTVPWPVELMHYPPSIAAAGVDRRTVPYATAESMTGLVTVFHSPVGGERTSLSVVGDEPEDFALARLWTLTFGSGVWLPSVFDIFEDRPSLVGRSRLRGMVDDLADERISTVFTSTSHDLVAIESLVGRLELRSGAGWRTVVQPADLDWHQAVRTHLAVDGQFEEHHAVPTTVDASGTRSMAAPLPPPVLEDIQPPPIGELIWHVDVAWSNSKLVRGRGLDDRELCASNSPPENTWVRSARNAISFQSKRVDLILSGVTDVNRLARPLLCDLSLEAWVYAAARSKDLVARLSEPGHRAALIERMFGERAGLVEFFGGPLLPALRAMRPEQSQTTDAYPNGEGVVLAAGEGVLAFEGFRLSSRSMDPVEVRERLDAALRPGVLRRGLVLECSVCTRKQFQPIVKIGQTWTCTRCDVVCDLDMSAWKLPPAEPTWYYDLHPVARDVLRENGEVASLLSKFLRSDLPGADSEYQDVEGLEVLDNGVPQVELDLIAHAAGKLVIAECKSTSELSGKRGEARNEVWKKCRAAEILGADILVFATTAPAWNDRAAKQIQGAIDSFEWGATGAADVHLVAGLGADRPTVQVLTRFTRHHGVG
ncbi:hypothetical protein [Lentzea jiangxiensis]|uniref:hypothetical protein n=1 Tax=Lentzea jiangxiensis TaxID=641025 RepID=UPI00115FAB29|nr:hypothetical protein [Lentzea jiangxiensis]